MRIAVIPYAVFSLFFLKIITPIPYSIESLVSMNSKNVC